MTEEILDKVRDINLTLKKSGVPTIELPKFPVSVSIKVPVIDIGDSLDGDVASDIANEAITFSFGNFRLGRLIKLFAPVKVDVGAFKDNISSAVKNEGHEKLNLVFENLSTQIEKDLEDIFDKFMSDCDDMSLTCQKIFETTLDNINVVLDETTQTRYEPSAILPC